MFSGDRSLVSRICRLRLFAVLVAIPSVLIPANAASGGVLFQSNWDTAAGTSTTAVTDGGQWPNYWEFNNGTGVQLISVVSGGPNGHNALRVQQRGSTFAANVQINDVVPLATDFYVRYYMRNDDTSGSGDHIVTPDTWGYPNLTYMRKYSGASGWNFVVSMYGCGFVYPISHWGPSLKLANGQWYRFEYYVHYVDATHIQVHPRVYNAAGALILSDADFLQEDYLAGGTWNGRQDWTLASYYAAGFTFCVDPGVATHAGGHNLTNFGMGNNGNFGAADTGLYWYFAAVQIRNDTWPGPDSPSGDTTPPTVSLTAPVSGATVSGSAATLSATASDNVGVAGVQFTLDGTPLGAERTSAPYAVSWDTTTASNGSHTLRAIARDAAGNQTPSAGVPVTVSNSVPPPPAGGLATLYPGDVGIETHPDVVFVEKFEEATLTDLLNQWTDNLNGAAMAFSPDVPPGSPGSRSLSIPWVGGGVSDGGNLYKQLSPGVDDTLYVRYYIKYPTSGQYQHEGIWMGGYNPPLAFPNPQAGVRPTGSDRFLAAAEQSDDLTHFDHYDYWMDMRVSPDGKYWGNTLLNDPTVRIPTGQWACVEHMVKLNNPVTAFNGEHAIWINGVEVSHLGPGFPNGFWTWGNFTQDPSGSPFDGFRWRSTTNLKLNWIWLMVYAPNDPAGFTGTIKYDHVVAAKSYVGCLVAAASDTTPPTVSISAPLGGATVSNTVTVSAAAADNVGVVGVQFKLDGANLGAEDLVAPYSVSWNTTTVPNGAHTLKASARDAAGNATTSASISVIVANADATPPTVAITAPTSNPTFSTSTTPLTLGGTASDNVGVTQVTWVNSAGGSGTATGTTSWTASGIVLQPGANGLTVTATDAAGNTATDALTVTLSDTTPPAVSITAPAAGATVTGTITVSATATDNVGVAGVQFKLDGVNLGAEVTTAPYAVAWDTTAVTKTSHTLTAVARDAAGNLTTSAAVRVTVVASVSVSLAPQDTYLNLDAVNYSADATLGIYTWPDNKPGNTILMRFDLSGIPAGATVYSAALNLFLVQSDTAPEATYTITAHKLINQNPDLARATGYTSNGTKSWTANLCCYNSIPLAQADISPAYAAQAINKTTGYKTWDVAAMVQEWSSNPSTNFGLLLNADVSKLQDRFRYFASTKNINASMRPYLTIAYGSATETTPPTVAITSPTSSATYTTSTSPLTLGGTASDNVGVTQVTWANSQGGNGTATGTTSWTASGIVLGAGTNVLTVAARDAAGNTATATLTVTLSGTLTFTDDPVAAQSTLIKAVHIMELRAAIDSVRVARGLATFAWSDSTLTPGSTLVKAVFLIELRTALSQAYQAAGRTSPTYTDPTVGAGLAVIKAIHLNELRAAVRAL